MWGVVRKRKGIESSLATIKSCRAARPDGERIYVILDNLNAHKGKKIIRWCEKHNVELCLTPTYSSWANPIECHFGPLRDFVLNNSDHPNHVVLTGGSTLTCVGATPMRRSRPCGNDYARSGLGSVRSANAGGGDPNRWWHCPTRPEFPAELRRGQ